MPGAGAHLVCPRHCAEKKRKQKAWRTSAAKGEYGSSRDAGRGSTVFQPQGPSLGLPALPSVQGRKQVRLV